MEVACAREDHSRPRLVVKSAELVSSPHTFLLLSDHIGDFPDPVLTDSNDRN